MPITSGNIEYHLSGGAANTSPASSLGGAMSTAAGGIITTATLNNLWADVLGPEDATGSTKYRAIYVYNNNGSSITWLNVVAWIDSLTVSPDTEFDIALASEAVNTAIAQTLANDTTAPTGVTFSRPTTKAAALAIGNIPDGQFKGIWLRRTVNAGAGTIADTGSIRVEGDTT